MKTLFTLQPDETLEFRLRTTLAVWLPVFVLSALFVTGAFLFMVRLWREGAVGIALFTVLLVMGVWMGFARWWQYTHTELIATSHRLISIKQRSLFDRQMEEVVFPSIKTISFRRKGFFASLLRYGKLRLEMTGSKKALFVGPFSQPEVLVERLYALAHDTPHV